VAVTKVRASTQLVADSATFTALAVSATASASTDVVNLGTLEQKITQGRTWKEAILHSDQLVDGVAGGIRSAVAIWGTGLPLNNDTLVLKNDTVTETFTFKDAPAVGFDVQIGADIAATLASLVAEINASSDATDGFEAVMATDLASFSASVAVVYETKCTGGMTSRAYNTVGSALRYSDYTDAYDYRKPAGAATLPVADPAVRTFGFARGSSGLAGGEAHNVLDGTDAPQIWDADGAAWSLLSGAMIQGNGITITGATIAVNPDTTGGANLARAVSVVANGVAIKIDDSTIGEAAGTYQLFVKDGGVAATQLASNAVTTIKINANAVTAAKVSRTVEEFTGADLTGGSSDTLTLASTPASSAFLQIFVGGILQRPGALNDYTLAANVVTFLAIPASADNITAILWT